MARTNGTETASENGTATAEGTQSADRKPGRNYIVVPLPENIKQMFVDEAKAADVPVGPYVARQLANFRNFELPLITTSRRRKYATPEEAKAAQKSSRLERNNLVKQLLAAHKERMVAAAGGGAPAETQAEPVAAGA